MVTVAAAIMAAFPDPPDPEKSVRREMNVLRRVTAEIYKDLNKVYRLNRFGFGSHLTNLQLGQMAIALTRHCALRAGQAITPYSALPARFWNMLVAKHVYLTKMHRCQKCTVVKSSNGEAVKSCPHAFKMFRELSMMLLQSRMCMERGKTPETPKNTAVTVELRRDSPMEDCPAEAKGQVSTELFARES